jgi:hypothetical protein
MYVGRRRQRTSCYSCSHTRTHTCIDGRDDRGQSTVAPQGQTDDHRQPRVNNRCTVAVTFTVMVNLAPQAQTDDHRQPRVNNRCTVGSLFKPLGAYEKHKFWLKLYETPTPAFTVLCALPWSDLSHLISPPRRIFQFFN